MVKYKSNIFGIYLNNVWLYWEGKKVINGVPQKLSVYVRNVLMVN